MKKIHLQKGITLYIDDLRIDDWSSIHIVDILRIDDLRIDNQSSILRSSIYSYRVFVY